MADEQVHHLESIIKNWLNNGAQCNSSLKPYKRSLYPTYQPGSRTKRTDYSPQKSQPNKKPNHNRSILPNKSIMIEMCEDFLRNNKDLLNI
ncbi:unnamed protein product [Rotaria socialis]|uniref:Uncharacterized protein n=1 Tax=Rotaria socialis TaxID=392032 RepID=A0A818C4H9_9BILA|nr:unnamed protein product [Rotaria socialis]CAF3330643.1 unnamed protein product [Rotaria socialis]CAF3427682.1 unnamed protein product [Rotaria socialis]CAF3772817.1 unnamed protein product [Rotaria socialis]CAF4233467.1 unnamed protein product [Rotaria socialis]